MIQIDMPMPSCCAECPCLGYKNNAYICNVVKGIRTHIDKKPKWCPLVDLDDDGK